MALGQCTLTRVQRERAAALVRALVIAQLVLAVCIVLLCYNAAARALRLVVRLRRRAVLLLYGAAALHAYCMKLHYTMGLRLVTLLLKYSYWRRLNALCLAWLSLGVLVALNGLVIAFAVRNAVRLLTEDIREELRLGITQYLSEPGWKKLFDSIQIELQCCGIERPSDWYETPWISMDFLNHESDIVLMMAGADARILPPVTPFSCCNPRTLGPCYHDPLQQANLKEVWQAKAELVARSLHERGCLDAVREPLQKAAGVFSTFTTIVFIIQIFVVVLTQALRTAARGAVLSGRRGGPARGWLLASATPSSTLARRKLRQTSWANAVTAAERGGAARGGTSTALLLLERRRVARRAPHVPAGT